MGSRRHGSEGFFLGRRMRSSMLLLGGVTLTAFIAAATVTALASFGVQVLPQGVHRQLARSGGMSMTVIGLVDAGHAAADTNVIRARARTALDGVPYQLDSAVWSDPLVITAPDGRTNSGAEVASPDRITANASLVAGAWPGRGGRGGQPGQPIPAALPVTVASQFRAGPGAVLAVRDSNTGARLRLRVSGVYRQRDPGASYWSLDAIWTCGARVPGCFTAGGPVVVNPGTFADGGFTVDQASWVLVPDVGRIPPSDLGGLAGRIRGAENYLQGSAALGGLVVTSGIPAALTSAAIELTAARSLLAVGIALLLLPAAGALVLAARLLATHREESHALARARGAGWRALAVPALGEALGVGGAGAVAGVLVGARLAVPLASTGILNGDGLILSGIPPQAWWLGAAVLVLCAVTMTWPALRARPPGAVAVRRGRQAALAGAAVTGADFALLALAAVAVWQLRSYSASGGTGIDPVVVAAPALALAAVSLIPVRLLPLFSRGLARVAAGSKRLGSAMAGWEISRLPVRRAGPVLLTVLAVATGTLALAEYQSWRQSAQDQATFMSGADMRIDTTSPVPLGAVASIARSPGITAAMPVASVDLGSGSLLAVNTHAAQDTVLLRPDLSPLPSGALWRQIMPSSAAAGEALPGHPLRLDITASLTPLSGGVSFPASALVADSLGDVFSLPAGNLPADGRPHALAVSLSAGRQGASYPLRLLGLEAAGVPGSALAPVATHPARLAVHGVAASASAVGPFPAPLAGDPPQTWQLSASPSTGTLAVTAPAPAGAITGIATSAFLRANNVAVGSTYPASVGAVSVPVKIVAEVSAFPTVTGADGGLIADQSAVQDYLAANAQQPLQVTSWWLRTSGAALPAVPAGAVVTDRSAQTADLLGDSLSAAPQQAGLAVALAAALLAVMGFAASVAASLRDRRTRRVLLNALGVPMFAQARQLCLEELVLSVPAAVAGLLAGIGLARLIIAAVVLTPDGASPVPPVLVRIPLGWAAGLAVAVCVVPVLAALATAAQRPDTAARLRGAETA
jgi:FtsX-like permease family protein